MDDILDNFAKSIYEVQAELKKAETHCINLSVEVLKQKSEHFKKVDVHYEADGLVCTYKCNIDDKFYRVKVSPQK